MSVFLLVAFLFANMPLPAFSENTYNAVLPRSVTALRGSCLQILCTFNVSDFKDKLNRTENIFGVWLKTTHPVTSDNVVFNSSKTIIRGFSHAEMLGNLSRRECTTVFYDVMNNHSDVYYFRVQMEQNVFRATFATSPVIIKVSDVSNPPELNGPQEVMEGTAVNLSCSAEAPCPKQPPTLSWSYIPKSASITTQLQQKHDQTQAVFSTMTFIASYMEHKQNISCIVTYPRNISNNTTVERTIKLQVLFSPKETQVIIDPSASVPVGTNVTLTCKSKASPSTGMNFTWYKRGQQKHLASGEQMTFNVSRINVGWYFCKAENKHGAQWSKEIQLIVEGSSQSSVSLIAGCVGGVIAFLLLLFFPALIFTRWKNRRTQSPNESFVTEADISGQDHKTHLQVDSVYSNSAFVANEQPEMSKNESDIIHYGEINFSTLPPKQTTDKSSGQETVYAEVCNPEKR